MSTQEKINREVWNKAKERAHWLWVQGYYDTFKYANPDALTREIYNKEMTLKEENKSLFMTEEERRTIVPDRIIEENDNE